MTAPDGPGTAHISAAAQPARRPLLVRATVARCAVELHVLARNRQSLAFTMALPVLLLVVFASIFTGNVQGTSVPLRQVYVAGILAAGLMSVSFSALAINVAIERDTGVISRLATTPMPRSAYFIGKLVRVAVTVVLEAVVMIALGVAVFGLALPRTGQRWLTLGWVTVLGSISCALLAVAYSRLVPNARSAAAAVTPPFLVLQFISGVFYPYSELPRWMQAFSALFPLKWLAQGFRSVFLPEGFMGVEPARNWELARTAEVLGLWSVVALLLCLLTFRWQQVDDR